MSNFVFGLSDKDFYRAFLITLVCFGWPFLQSCILLFYCYRHPQVFDGPQFLESKEDVNGKVVKGTEENFKGLMKSILKGVAPHHHKKLFTWLLVEEVNVNNYEDKYTIEATTKVRNGVSVDVREVNTETWICEFLNEHLEKMKSEVTNNTTGLTDDSPSGNLQKAEDIETEHLKKLANHFQKNPKERVDQTPMMKVIDHHVKIVAWVNRLKQLNIQFESSDETLLREKRLPFRRVVECLRDVDDVPRLPKALGYVVIRELKVKEWSRENDGTPLNPIILSERPWGLLKQQASSYVISFMKDLWLHWAKLWIIFVLFGIILAKG